MATPFFGKRENETPTGLRNSPGNGYGNSGSASTLHSAPLSSQQNNAAKPVNEARAVHQHRQGRRQQADGGAQHQAQEAWRSPTATRSSSKAWWKPPWIRVVIQIAEQAPSRSSAEIDVAEIRGEFTGNLTVRQKLVIYSTGKVTGVIRYGKLVIEEGGQLSGEILFGVAPQSRRAR